MLGQPGRDVFIGNGGDDMIDARDGVRDYSIQCARGHPRPRRPGDETPQTHPPIPATGHPEGLALTDANDPSPPMRHGPRHPVPGLNG